MIKLLALDLDGTTFDSSGHISDANRAAIRAAEDIGVLVTIATGRRFRDARPVGIDLRLNAPLITHNGALIKYGGSLETVACSLLSTEMTLEIIRVGKDLGGDALVSTDPHGLGTMLYDRISSENTPLQEYIRWSSRMHGDEVENSVEHVESLEAVIADHETVHISFSGRCSRMAELEIDLQRELGERITLLTTAYPSRDFTLIDILPIDASKGHGVAKLTELNDLTAENVMCIGDNFNDLEMLEYAGTPVVMGNAARELLERAEFYTTLSNDESGVAAAIERFILNQENN